MTAQPVVPADLRALYQELILDHAKHPRNFGALEHATYTAEGHNPSCGDRLTLFIETGADGRIAAARFAGKGCAISTASASILTELVVGKTIEEAETMFRWFHHSATEDTPPAEHIDEDAADHLSALAGVRQYPMRVKCATLAWHALDAALHSQKGATTE